VGKNQLLARKRERDEPLRLGMNERPPSRSIEPLVLIDHRKSWGRISDPNSRFERPNYQAPAGDICSLL